MTYHWHGNSKHDGDVGNPSCVVCRHTGRPPRPIHEIAADIARNWENVNYAARPYLVAMQSLTAITDDYYADSALSVVSYFLSNANGWRGDAARRIKQELRDMLPCPTCRSRNKAERKTVLTGVARTPRACKNSWHETLT